MRFIFAILVLTFCFSALAVSPYQHDKQSKPKWHVKERKNIKRVGDGGLRFGTIDPSKRDRYPAHRRESDTSYKHHEHWDFGMGM